jgi:hypothetical protein
MKYQQIKNILPDLMFIEVSNLIAQAKWKYGWRSSRQMGFGHWNFDYAGADAKNCLDVSKELDPLLADTWEYLKKEYFPDSDLLRCYTNSHTFGVEGYPHTDSTRAGDRTVVIYINKKWEREWGGETTLYLGDEIEHAELPRANNGLVFDGKQLHCARGLTRICPAQRITLMFKFAPIGIDPTRQRLQAFLTEHECNTIKHSKRNLMAHLLGVYDLLRQAGQPDDVCAAGGLHSIFGTNTFKTKTLDLGEIETVAQEFGERVAYLAELFSKLARPSTLESAIKSRSLTLELTSVGRVDVTRETLQELCEIEAANLVEQRYKNWARLPVLNSMAEKYLAVIQ